MTQVSNEKFVELLFLTLFSAFFASRLQALESIGLTLGTNPDSVFTFIVYNIVCLLSFHQVRVMLAGSNSRTHQIGYLVLAFVQGFAPYFALQASWWVEYSWHGVNKGLINPPENLTQPLAMVYFVLLGILPIIISLTQVHESCES